MNKSSLGKKLVILAFILLAANIPRWLLGSLNEEREVYQNQAVAKIVEGFASPQTFGEKSLQLVVSQQHEPAKKGGAPEFTRHSISVGPKKADTRLSLEFQERRKGIFKVPVFVTQALGSGKFTITREQAIKSARLGSSFAPRLKIEKASVLLNVDDVRRLTEVRFKANGKPVEVTRTATGVEFELPLESIAAFPIELSYEFEMKLRGFKQIRFIPSAAEESLAVAAPWTDPNFAEGLPSDYKITDRDFTANWSFINADATAQAAVLEFYQTGTIYQLTERSRKYGSFIIIFMLVAFFLYEVLGALRMHFMHYLFLMLPVSLFFLLLLALAEHTGFNVAYVSSAIAVIVLMSGYLRGIGFKLTTSLSFGALEVVLFGMIFVILQSADYALLLGAIALFLILGGAMFVTRKVDWEALDGSRPKVA